MEDLSFLKSEKFKIQTGPMDRKNIIRLWPVIAPARTPANLCLQTLQKIRDVLPFNDAYTATVTGTPQTRLKW